MIPKINIKRSNGYLNIAKSGGYVIWGTDGLKGYTHKLYLIVYRQDFGKTIEKTLNRFKDLGIKQIMLSEQDFNDFVGFTTCKILAIKNKGIAEQIINLLRGEDG